MPPKLALKVLACEVASREIAFLKAFSPHYITLEFLPVGHHDDSKTGHLDLQERIDRIPANQFDAILVGYGLCNQMLNGLTARNTPLVIPRAHDCLTFFFGSRERYTQIFETHTGAFYFTAGWLEFGQLKALRKGGLPALKETPEDFVAQPAWFNGGKSYADMVAKYGEDNARYLMEVAHQWTQNYSRGLLITSPFDAPLKLPEKTQAICAKQGWKYEEMPGDWDLLQRWMHGQWDEKDFLVVAPNQSVQPTYNDQIIEAR